MKSRWLTNFFLIMAIGILSLIAHFKPGVEKPTATVSLTPLKQNDIKRLQIERSLLPTLTLIKNQDSWFIEHNPPLPADPLQIAALTRLAEQTVTRRYNPTELDLAQIELMSPDTRITLNEQTLAFGGVDPLDGLRYVKTDHAIHLIEDLYQNQLQADFTRFIRRRLFATNQKITALSLPGLTMSQHEGQWQVSPKQDISADQLQLFIERWQAASALNIQKMDADITGESASITLAGREQPIDFIIQSSETQLILARPEFGIQYKLGNRRADFLSLPTPVE